MQMHPDRVLTPPLLAALIVATLPSVGCGGSSPPPPPTLLAGTYLVAAGAPGCAWSGIQGGGTCSATVTLTGSGPVYTVTQFDVGVTISIDHGTVTQAGDQLTASIVVIDSGSCGGATFSGTGTVGGSSATMHLALSAPVSCCYCGTSSSMDLELTRQ